MQEDHCIQQWLGLQAALEGPLVPEKNMIVSLQVEDQIERLRMVEMEKQLELKEMATRQKIQALKQKLLGTSGGAVQLNFL